jgi:hypothetical protein
MPTGYTPPAGNAVNLNFTGPYTPPAGNNVILNFFNTNAYVLTADAGSYTLAGAAASIKAGRLLRAYGELVVTGEFETSDVSGWTISGADTTLPVVSGEGRLTLGPGAAGGYAYQAIAVTPGQPYTIDTHLIVGSAGSGLSIGTAAGGSQIASAMAFPSVVLVATPTSVTTHPLGPVSISFIAPAGGVIYVSLNSGGANSCYARCAYVRMQGGGTYTLTGAPATLTKTGRRLVADAGTYSLSGSDMTMKVGRRLTADPGVYIQTRATAQLKFGHYLAAGAGSYVINPSAASIAYIVGRYIHAERGSYALAGSDVRLLVGRKMPMGGGSYALTGTDLSWVYRRVIKAAPGTYALTGTPMVFLIGYRLAATSGTYALVGADLNLVNRRLTADSGSYGVAGSAAGLLVGKRLQAAPGAYTITGVNTALLYSRRLALAPGSYALSWMDLGLRVGRRMSMLGGAYVLNGATARVLRGYTVHATPGAYALTGSVLGFGAARRMSLQSGSLTLNWLDVALVYQRTPPGPRSIAVGFAASRYLAVSSQNRRVVAGRQDRRVAVERAARRYAAVEPRDKEPMGGSMLQWPEKDPNEVLDYQLDWADPEDPRLETSELLLTSVWSIVLGDVVIDSSSFTAGGLSTVWTSAGSAGMKCELLNRVTTSKGRTYDKTVVLRIRTH